MICQSINIIILFYEFFFNIFYSFFSLDICKAIESVKELKCGFELINLKNGKKAVVTIPMQMSNSTNILIKFANENNGCITCIKAMENLNITESVFNATIVYFYFYFYYLFFIYSCRIL